MGMAAWLMDKFRDWADCNGEAERVFSREELLTHVSLDWFTGTIASSCRVYLESWRAPLVFRRDERIVVPLRRSAAGERSADAATRLGGTCLQHLHGWPINL
jgi:hypothetical protein